MLRVPLRAEVQISLIRASAPDQRCFLIVRPNKTLRELRHHPHDEAREYAVETQSSRAALRAEVLRASAFVNRSYAATMSATIR